MDCEKAEPLLLDELYEELDELTSAAVKRHVSGCARCAGVFNGMRSARSAAALPIMAVPVGLEEKILAAAKEAAKQQNNVVPFKAKVSRVISIAGSWAMRPQTAMAAVFLLMIGTSAFLIRSKDYRSNDSAVSVTVAGSPSPTAAGVAQSETIDDRAAASAHGPSAPPVTRPPPMPTVAAMEAPAAAGPVDRMARGDLAEKEQQGQALGALGADKDEGSHAGYGGAPPPAANAGPPAGAPMADGMTQQPGAMARHAGKNDDPYSLGSAAFQARNYAEAAKQFDLAAKSGDRNAELWAAESVREGQGCAMAVGRFEALANKAPGQWVGNEASLRAAKCQIALGQTDAAKTRLAALAQSSTHQQQAQATQNDLNQAIAAKSGSATVKGAAAAPRKAAAKPAPLAPRSEASEAEKKAVDHGY
ncbi:MAG: hypothetical protein KIT84_35165 [Labilithrix sp.]|nr:hypothetical protein [Labilithrix sp.]MCW5816291.1 hypothetical protein [Labilithrix sp.]